MFLPLLCPACGRKCFGLVGAGFGALTPAASPLWQGVGFLLRKSGALDNPASGSSSCRKPPRFGGVPGTSGRVEAGAFPGRGDKIFIRFYGLWGCREGRGFSSGTSAGGGAASCLPSGDLFPPLVTEGSQTWAQTEGEGEAAQLSLQGPGEEEEEDPHRSQQLSFAAPHHAGDVTDPCLGSSFGINP